MSDAAFCPFVLEIFTLGITTGTTPTTYDPTSAVNRLQMAAFLSRTVDSALKRGSRRAVLTRYSSLDAARGLTTVGSSPRRVISDGADLWVTGDSGGTVSRVRSSDGKLLETWTGGAGAEAVRCALGNVFVTGYQTPGRLYRIDPAKAAGVVTTVASNLGANPYTLAFDGFRFWTANRVLPGSVSIVTPGDTLPWTVTTVASGFAIPTGILYDGANIWVTNGASATLVKLDSAGAILQTVTTGQDPQIPLFDGSNIWVPNYVSDSVSVIRASNGAVLATLTGNGLDGPYAAAFDGERVLVTNLEAESVSLWKAANLTAIGTVSTGPGTQPSGVCSDGINFWIALRGINMLGRF